MSHRIVLACATLLLLSPCAVVADESAPSASLSFEKQSTGESTAPKVAAATINNGVSSRAADAEDTAAAIGHYHRARTMLVAAVREFDKGYKLASPEAVLNGQQWRQEVLDRAEDLIKVLDPQPRVSRSGVRYESSSSLLREDGGQ